MRVVYDTMIILQWAALPAHRVHATIQAVEANRVTLCMSKQLFAEIRDVLSRPDVRAKAPTLTGQRFGDVMSSLFQLCEWIDPVPDVISYAQHPDDDHLLNLAIAAKAHRIVTWEKRLLRLLDGDTPISRALKSFSDQLAIVTPTQLIEQLSAT